jgi:hypothetical protein
MRAHVSADCLRRAVRASAQGIRHLTAVLLGVLIAAPAAAVEPGEARVLSLQGQRLKVEIPYASAPGEPVSVVRFSVVAAGDPSGQVTLGADTFALLQPEASNRVILRSAEPVNADRIDLVLGLGEQPGRQVLYRLVVPR